MLYRSAFSAGLSPNLACEITVMEDWGSLTHDLLHSAPSPFLSLDTCV